ncbi:TlpA family protein disulfide reductase [Lacibacter sediminis]|uniref:TlpA family protein disulfide reductase n=1 Tax=Lacibacter sediminis TaxID=2760713 RepID=A0A7G5XLD9_9BACT|nr:TlpA disulfide reductase family protein [Lacibacter sediminis]QNA46292.1 TlpA family protein disulfide reductase [Lacibacter sediminis]
MKSIYKIAVAFLLLLVSCKEKESNNNKDKPTVVTKGESEFDKIKLTELDGTPIELHQYEGKTIFINFWATWCGPCIQEMPSIQKAKTSLKDEDIVFLFASNEEVEAIEAFKKKQSYDFHYVRVENLEQLNIIALPTTYIFNPDKKLVFSEMGYRKWDNKNNIDLILNAAK